MGLKQFFSLLVLGNDMAQLGFFYTQTATDGSNNQLSPEQANAPFAFGQDIINQLA